MRLINADEITFKYLIQGRNPDGSVKYMRVTDEETLLNATIVEFIRCKNCEWWLPPHGCNHDDGLIYSTEDAFCSYAERRML